MRVLPARTGLFLRQHRTIPALRLKHRSGSCGTASAAPRSPYRHLELCGIALIGLIGLLLRFCPRNGGADAIGKGGARRKAGIRRKLGDIRLQKHDLLRPVRDFA